MIFANKHGRFVIEIGNTFVSFHRNGPSKICEAIVKILNETAGKIDHSNYPELAYMQLQKIILNIHPYIKSKFIYLDNRNSFSYTRHEDDFTYINYYITGAYAFYYRNQKKEEQIFEELDNKLHIDSYDVDKVKEIIHKIYDKPYDEEYFGEILLAHRFASFIIQYIFYNKEKGKMNDKLSMFCLDALFNSFTEDNQMVFQKKLPYDIRNAFYPEYMQRHIGNDMYFEDQMKKEGMINNKLLKTLDMDLYGFLNNNSYNEILKGFLSNKKTDDIDSFAELMQPFQDRYNNDNSLENIYYVESLIEAVKIELHEFFEKNSFSKCENCNKIFIKKRGKFFCHLDDCKWGAQRRYNNALNADNLHNKIQKVRARLKTANREKYNIRALKMTLDKLDIRYESIINSNFALESEKETAYKSIKKILQKMDFDDMNSILETFLSGDMESLESELNIRRRHKRLPSLKKRI